MRLIILGAGGHGRVVADIAEQVGKYDDVIFLDDNSVDDKVLGKCSDYKKFKSQDTVPGGYDAIVNEIARLRPDFVTLSEVRNYENTNFTARLVHQSY